MDVIEHHELDETFGIDIDELELASNQATLVALQAGRVDCVVADWLWVSRQRAAGADWTFFPFSTALGALVAARGAPIHRLADLRNRRLGVAGSPIDKSWIILQALAQEQHIDLAHDAQLSFGAPPLLNQELLAGRLDAVLTYWNFAAPLAEPRSAGGPLDERCAAAARLQEGDSARGLRRLRPAGRGSIRRRWPTSCARRERLIPSWRRRMPNGTGSAQEPERAIPRS